MNKTFIGTILAPFGLRGELKVKSESDFIDQRFHENQEIWCEKPHFSKKVTITSYRIHNNQVLITVDHLEDINLINDFIGCKVYSEAMVEVKENEYLLDNLIGLKVIDEANNYYGKVIDIIKIPSNDILEVVDDDKKVLIPFINDYIIEIKDDVIRIKQIEWLKS